MQTASQPILENTLALSVCSLGAAACDLPFVLTRAILMTPSHSEGWRYLWNPDGKRVGKAADYTELVPVDTSSSSTWKGYPEWTLATSTDTSKQRGDMVVRGGAAGWLVYGMSSGGVFAQGHVGQSDDDGDHCFIAGWTTPEDQHYAITDSSIMATRPFQWLSASTGHTRPTDGLAVHVYVDDALQVECTATTNEGKTGHSEFNCVLGTVAKGATVYVAVCGNGSSDWDTFQVDYKIAKGVKAEIVAAAQHKTTAEDVTDMLGTTVADFRADFTSPDPSNRWKYKYNPSGTLDDFASFVDLKANPKGEYTCGGKADGAVPSGDCKRGTDWLSIKKFGVHPGAGQMYSIIEYTVAEYGLYSITDSLVTSPMSWEGSENSDGVEVEVFVLPPQGGGVAQKKLMKVVDNFVGFQTKDEGWAKRIGAVAFDSLLGILAQGSRIFVCVGNGPEGDNGHDYADIAFKISKGPVPLLTPRDGTNSADATLPLLGGGLRKQYVVFWAGVARANEWKVVAEGDDNAVNQRLPTGAYVFTTDPISSFKAGGVMYAQSIVSVRFAWTNQPTNGAQASTIQTHENGHASNGEVLQFRTVEHIGDTGKQLQLQFMPTLRGWTETLKIRFTFTRVA